MTCAEVKSDAAEEVVADESVKVPDGQLNAAVLELEPGDVLEDERVVPGRVAVASDDRALVRRSTRTVRQQTTAQQTNVQRRLLCKLTESVSLTENRGVPRNMD